MVHPIFTLSMPSHKTPRNSPPKDLNNTPTADLKCLIIQVHPPITAEERPNGMDTRTKINEMLDKTSAPQYFRIRVVGYSGAGNIKITSTDSCKASDLMVYGKAMAGIITKNKVLSVLPDAEHHRIKINKVPTNGANDDPITIAMVHEELQTYVPEYKNMKQWRIPRWLGSDEYIRAKQYASIVIDLANEEDRDTLLSLKRITLFNANCTVTPYEERAQAYQCSKCGMFSHCTASCRQPRCLTCALKDHLTDDHPPEEKPNCVNCKSEHTSGHKECNARRNCLGMKPIPTL